MSILPLRPSLGGWLLVGLKTEEMNIPLLVRLNRLWEPIYPYLARWVVKWCPKEPGWVLELGPFSGGISRALMGLYKDMRGLCLVSQIDVARSFKREWSPSIQTIVGPLEALPFQDTFDLLFFRGAFFFLTPEGIKEAYRVLRSGAYALLGGGSGPLTPYGEIKRIAEESKILNEQLGKRWISRIGLEEMVKEARMERVSQILEEGGLWLLLRKDL
jgi:hypothetical protein